MIYIKKGNAPKKLSDYKKSPDAVYPPPKDVKEKWRDTLLEEQGYLCAYTMERVEPGLISDSNKPKVKLEHINPQNGDKNNDLSHKNVVAVCNGNEGESPKNQYADTRKGEDLLDRRLHPTNSDIEKIICYRPNGEIFTGIRELDMQLTDDDKEHRLSVLNLNYKTLRDAREGAYEAVKIRLNKKNWSLSAINDEIKRFESLHNNKRLAFCGFVLYRLRKDYNQRLKRDKKE
jgi:uncharacterized protein (TIGR02646 family)